MSREFDRVYPLLPIVYKPSFLRRQESTELLQPHTTQCLQAVIPAMAGIHGATTAIVPPVFSVYNSGKQLSWIPAFAGMTMFGAGG